jgi:hypothetical protein
MLVLALGVRSEPALTQVEFENMAVCVEAKIETLADFKTDYGQIRIVCLYKGEHE